MLTAIFILGGVYVSDAFKPTGHFGETERKVACLESDRSGISDRLLVSGDNLDDSHGYAFAIFDAGEAMSKPLNTSHNF